MEVLLIKVLTKEETTLQGLINLLGEHCGSQNVKVKVENEGWFKAEIDVMARK